MNLKTKLNSILPKRLSGNKSQPRWQAGDTLEFYIPRHWPDQDSVVRWCRRSNGEITGSGQTNDLASLAGIRKNARVVAWIPASETLLTQAQVPSKSRRKILRALPYALEDQLLGDPEAQHYTYSASSGTALDVAVVLRETLQKWLVQLSDAGLPPRLLAPVNLALPFRDNAWTLFVDNTEIWIRTGRHSGFMVSGDDQSSKTIIMTALNEAKSKSCLPQQLLFINAPDTFTNPSWLGSLEIEIQNQTASLWETLAPSNCSLNLLQGEFSPAKESNPALTRLRPAFVLLALWLAASVSANIWEWYSLSQKHRVTTSEMVRIFRTAFPESKVVVDPVLQMQRKLDELQSSSGAFGNNDFLALLSTSTPALRTGANSQLTGLKYDQAGLILNLSLPDYQSMEAIKNRLDAAGLSVEVLSANSRSSGVESRLRVTSIKGGKT